MDISDIRWNEPARQKILDDADNVLREAVVAIARESDGIHVVLLWHPRENALTVSVEDARLGDRFQVAVAPDRALDAFYHPYAYAGSR